MPSLLIKMMMCCVARYNWWLLICVVHKQDIPTIAERCTEMPQCKLGGRGDLGCLVYTELLDQCLAHGNASQISFINFVIPKIISRNTLKHHKCTSI
jgi:hypothetical protein